MYIYSPLLATQLIFPKLYQWVSRIGVKCNCTDSEIQSAGYNEYKQFLMARGYAESTIDSAIEKAKEVPRDRLLGISEVHNKNSTGLRKYPLVIKFNPKLPPMSQFINKYLHILELTSETAKMFNKDSIYSLYHIKWNKISLTSPDISS